MNKLIFQKKPEASDTIEIPNLIGKILFFKNLQEESAIGVIIGLSDVTTYSGVIDCYVFSDNKISPIWFSFNELNRLSKYGFTIVDEVLSYSVE